MMRVLLVICMLCWPAVGLAGNDRMGVAAHFDQGWPVEPIMPLIRDLGVSWIRDGIEWKSVEKEKGVYAIPPQKLQWIKAAHGYGLKVCFLVNAVGGNKIYDNPYDPDAFARWAAWMAQQVGDDVDAFEIMNEPNNFGFSKYYQGTWNGYEGEGKVSAWVGKYVELMNKSAEAIRQVRPGARIIGLGSPAPVNFRQIAMGVSPAVTGMVDHPYSYHGVPEIVPWAATAGILRRDGIATADSRGTFASQMEMYRQQSAQYNGPKEIWLTEWGFPSYQPMKPGIYAGFTESAQAKYAQRRFMECLGLGVEVSIWYDFRNDGRNPHDAEHNFGLVDHALKPKPAYHAVKRIAEIMNDWTSQKWGDIKIFPMADRPDQWPIVWDGSKLAAPGTIPAYTFVAANGDQAVALWSAERADGDLQSRAADVEIVTSKKVERLERIDLLSGQRKEIKFTQKGQTISLKMLSIPDYPILLILSGSGVAASDDPLLTVPLFHSDQKWNFSLGAEFPGAKGGFKLVKDGNLSTGQLSFDFSSGGAYVAASTDVQIGKDIKEIRFQAKSLRKVSIGIRLTDSTGQIHQYSGMPYSQVENWQPFKVNLTEKAHNSWGGAKDGVLHFPLRSVSFTLGKTDQPGEALLSSFEWR